MTTNGSLEERISAALDGFSPKQRRLARFVLDNKYFMSFASASQAAEKTGSSAATVVRFAQSLGYDGFSEMQAAIRADLPSYMTAVERMQARLGQPPTGADIPHNILATDIQNIQRTANHLVGAKLEKAVQEILRAGHILVIGSGVSAGSALFLAHSLKVTGFDASSVLSGGLSLAVEVAGLRQGDLLVAIDLWRYSRATVQAVSAANQQGVRTIAITDSIVSPLAELADYAFEVATDSIDHSLSPTAVVSLINVLTGMLAFKAPEKVLESLRRVDAAYRDNDLLVID
jgi:DNA-binding MurR/RpiR family transcriptional regulator